LRSEVGSGKPIVAGGDTPDGVVTPGITERTVEGAVRQPEGIATPTVLEATLARDDMAVNQALMEMEVSVNERPRGSNIAVNEEGQYYRFKTLPTWIPKELRDGDLLDRVMKNISEGKKPRGNATQEQQLQEVVEAHISSRVKELKNTDTPTDSGVFSGDIAFAATLIAGGTYYLQSNDGTIAPVIAMGAMMKNPKLAKLVRESDLDKKFRRQEEEMWKERGMETKGDGTLEGKDRGATPDKLIQEAKKYKSAEEFVKAQEEKLYIHGSPSEIKGNLELKSKASGVQQPESNAVDALYVTPNTETGIMHSRMYTKQNGKTYAIKLKPSAKIFDYTNPDHQKMMDETMTETQKRLVKDNLIDGQLSWMATPPAKTIKSLGFDGMKVIERKKGDLAYSESFGDTTYPEHAESLAIFNKDSFEQVDILKTKSQLTDIWKEANKK